MALIRRTFFYFCQRHGLYINVNSKPFGTETTDNVGRTMKAFVIFPTICVFLLTMTLLTLARQTKRRTILLWPDIVTVLFAGLMTWLSVDAFVFLYYSNFIGVLVCIPCLTYLTNQLLNRTLDKRVNRIGVLGLGILSTAVTVATAVFFIFMSFMYNPMDPPTNKQSTEKTGN
jgi:hypothetical protein